MVLTSPNSIAAELARPGDQVRRVIGTLRCDFANGRIGGRDDTYQHRIRMTHQLTERRDSMRQALSGSGARV